MITLNHLVRKKSTVSAETFDAFWMGEHAVQCVDVAVALGGRRYVKCQTLHDDPANIQVREMYGTAPDSYDYVDQIYINDLEDFKTALANEETQQKLLALHKTAADYVDFSHSDYWFTVDVPQIFPRHEVRATADNSYLKIFYVPRRLEHLSLDAAQLHWNSCHGGLARQYAQVLPYDKYLQGHRKDSNHIWQLKSLLNTEFENVDSIIGQAEAWLDRNILPSLAGPEIENMMSMLLDDIDLFVTPPVSHIFATKEYVVLDRQVITRPVPSLFGVSD